MKRRSTSREESRKLNKAMLGLWEDEKTVDEIVAIYAGRYDKKQVYDRVRRARIRRDESVQGLIEFEQDKSPEEAALDKWLAEVWNPANLIERVTTLESYAWQHVVSQ